MRVGVAGVSPAELRALTRLLLELPATLAWVATGPGSLKDRLRLEPPDVLLVAAPGTFDVFGALAGSTTERDFAIVLVVDDPKQRVHEVYAALERGASEVARLPVFRPDGALDDADRLGAKLARLAARSGRPSAHSGETPVVVLGASAGGPAALASVLGGLSPASSLRVLIAQHIDDPFAAGLAEWLAAHTGLRVALAVDGAVLTAGTVLVTRSDAQPILEPSGRIRYRAFTPAEIFHPCIDALFSSCLRLPRPGVAALLTGMGEDGARGLLALRSAGWTTIAQDAATSAMFGMPAKAAAIGAASQVLPLTEIGPAISRAAKQHVGAVS